MKYLVFFSICFNLHAKLHVATTIQDLAYIAKEVGKEHIEVTSIAKGTQDPHYIEAKPSYMTKINRADLLISIGLDLEIGWLPYLIQGARNPNVQNGSKGYLEVGPMVDPMEIISGPTSRSDGDVHPKGNPHVTLDPKRSAEIAYIIAKKLAELDPAHASAFFKNAEIYQTLIDGKIIEWQKRIKVSNVGNVVTYHKTLNYFLNRFGIKNSALLEPKPGIPPTSAHIMNVIQLIKNEKIPIVLVENFFDSSVTKKIASEIPNIKISSVAVSVGGAENIHTLIDVFENIVLIIEGKK